MHLFDPGRGLMGGNGIVGGGIPLALGAAFSAQYRGTDQVAVTFFSDGAANQGVFAESLNLAALFQLPVIFICENNRYAATTPVKLSCAREAIAERAEAYGVAGGDRGRQRCDLSSRGGRERGGRARAGRGAIFYRVQNVPRRTPLRHHSGRKGEGRTGSVAGKRPGRDYSGGGSRPKRA